MLNDDWIDCIMQLLCVTKKYILMHKYLDDNKNICTKYIKWLNIQWEKWKRKVILLFFKCEPYYLKSDERLVTLKYKNKYFMYITTMNSMTKAYFCSFFIFSCKLTCSYIHIYVYSNIRRYIRYTYGTIYIYIPIYIYTCMHHTCTHTSIHIHIE